MPSTAQNLIPNPAHRLMNGGTGPDSSPAYWEGILREFRNHLAIVAARTSQLSALLPGAVAAQSADCLQDIDNSASLVEGLLSCLDAALTPGGQAISDVGDVVTRALRLAGPGIHRNVRVEIEATPGALRTRGAAVESALALLLMDLGRFAPGGAPLFPDTDTQRSLGERGRIRVTVHAKGGAVRMRLSTSRQARDTPSNWRLALAKALLAPLGGEIAGSPVGFEIQFRSP